MNVKPMNVDVEAWRCGLEARRGVGVSGLSQESSVGAGGGVTRRARLIVIAGGEAERLLIVSSLYEFVES